MTSAPTGLQHHPSDELLIEYASGALSEGWSLIVATHLALCPQCRRQVAKAEQAGGMLLHTIQCDAVGVDDGWRRMRERIAAQPRPAAAPMPQMNARDVPKASAPVLPQPLRDYLGSDVDGLKWAPLGRGAYHIPIKTGDGTTKVRLLRIPAGKPVPEHSHGGRELTLVLSGSFHDETGRYGRGDFEEADEDLEHKPIAGMDEDCICLVATDAPLRFRSWLLKVLQPVIGI